MYIYRYIYIHDLFDLKWLSNWNPPPDSNYSLNFWVISLLTDMLYRYVYSSDPVFITYEIVISCSVIMTQFSQKFSF